MRDGMINKPGRFLTAINHVAPERVVPFFHSITRLKIFIAGSVNRGLDDGECGARGLSKESLRPVSQRT
jgi:hypothetical protein